jgi:hypothetical protein
MAITKSSLGTFFGQPIKFHDGLSKPVVGSLVYDHATMRAMVYTGTDWFEIATEDLERLDEINEKWANRRNITDEYLEEQYPELRDLKEKYEYERDKLKVFEILKTDTGNTNA